MYERDGEESSLGRVGLQGALHPILVLRLLVQDEDDVSFLERELVLVVGLAVVESTAAAEAGEVVALEKMNIINYSETAMLSNPTIK